MKNKEYLWNLFEKTGDISTYLFYKYITEQIYEEKCSNEKGAAVK